MTRLSNDSRLMLLSAFFLALAATYIHTCLNVILELRGVSTLLISIGSMCQISFILFGGAFFARVIVGRRLSYIHGVTCAIGASAALLLSQTEHMGIHMALRILLGMGTTPLFIIAEIWLNRTSSELSRGKAVAIYAAMVAFGTIAGLQLAPLLGMEGLTPYLYTALFYALCHLPIAMRYRNSPFVSEAVTGGMFSILKHTPAIIICSLAFGIMEGSIYSLMTIYGLRMGMEQQAAVSLASMLLFGGIVAQAVLSTAIRRFQVHTLLLLCLGNCIAGWLLFPLLYDYGAFFWIFLLVFGGFKISIYPLLMVLVGRRYLITQLATASVTLIYCYALGCVIGPLMSALAMQYFGTNGILYFLAGVSLLSFLYTWAEFRQNKERYKHV